MKNYFWPSQNLEVGCQEPLTLSRINGPYKPDNWQQNKYSFRSSRDNL